MAAVSERKGNEMNRCNDNRFMASYAVIVIIIGVLVDCNAQRKGGQLPEI